MADPLYKFQVEGVKWLCEQSRKHGSAYLADYMGLGKSVQEIHAADELGLDFFGVVCPAIAVEDWRRKFIEWSAFGREIFVGTHAKPISAAGLPKRSVLINSYETALDHRKLWWKLPQGATAGLSIDEAHFAKNPSTLRGRAIYGAMSGKHAGLGINSIIRPFNVVWPTSGTPTPNGDPREIWPHLRMLRPYSIINEDTNLPMGYRHFQATFCVMSEGGMGKKVVAIRNADRLKSILGQFMLRRLPSACPDMPELRFELLPMRARSVPTDLAFEKFPDLVPQLERIIAEASGQSSGGELDVQIATARRLVGLLKIQATVDLVEAELDAGIAENVVIFAYHVDVCEQIAKRLDKWGVGLITGKVGASRRWEAIDAFQAGKNRVMVAEILAANTNTTLTACNNVVFAETDWVPDNNLQAVHRCRRIGQRWPVFARIISIVGTIDELLQGAARRKLQLMLRHTDTEGYGNASLSSI